MAMSRKCEICGKGQVFGNNVSHSNRHTTENKYSFALWVTTKSAWSKSYTIAKGRSIQEPCPSL